MTMMADDAQGYWIEWHPPNKHAQKLPWWRCDLELVQSILNSFVAGKVNNYPAIPVEQLSIMSGTREDWRKA